MYSFCFGQVHTCRNVTSSFLIVASEIGLPWCFCVLLHSRYYLSVSRSMGVEVLNSFLRWLIWIRSLISVVFCFWC